MSQNGCAAFAGNPFAFGDAGSSSFAAGSVDDGYDAWNDPYHIVLLVLRISLLLGIMPILLVLMTLGMLVVVMLFGLVIFMILLAMTTGL